MKVMFNECKELEILDLTKFKTLNTMEMSYMFNQCYKLKEIKGINNFNTSKVTNMEFMFSQCFELKYLDLTNFNTSNVTSMYGMFNKCYKLKEIKGINNFNTSKVTNMKVMFNECKELVFIDLSNFNTSNVTNMEFMFYACNKLQQIKGIDNFNISKVIYKDKMTEGCYYIDYIYFTNSNILIIDKPIAVIFRSIDRNINYPIACFKSDVFLKIQAELFKKYPNLKNKDTCFTFKGYLVNRFATLKQNKIDHNDIVLIYYSDDINNNNKNNNIDEIPIAIVLNSTDGSINYACAVYESDGFMQVEKNLLIEYPHLKFQKIVYLYNATFINKFGTIKDNKITNNSRIIVIIRNN